jgi:L-amino acid N-acyltransferase YncA
MREMIEIKDGRKVVITELRSEDLDELLTFFKALPEEDRVFLRMDVTDRTAVVQRLQESMAGKAHRLVARVGQHIVAYGVLEREGHGWQEHVGEMRLIVAREFQRAGLGMSMARVLYNLAVKDKVEVIVARMMAPQTNARRILERLGFVEETVLKDHVRDRRGRKQDLVLMRCDLQTLLQEMQFYFEQSDWQRVR